ncbi:MAG TPA: hypothetical protein VGR19_11050 [Allosphingosinicella sp.]|nr:hypothetical protein [Allosphingosinicella sp.]
MAGTKGSGAPAYDEDQLSAEEEAALKALETDNTPPPPDSSDEAPAPDDPAAASPPAPAPAADPGADPAAPPAADPAGPVAGTSENPEFQSWLEKHKDKTPEQLAELAFNANKRANREGFRARQSGETAAQAAARLEERRQDIERRRTEFEGKLKDDPDAATLALHNERLDQELADAEAEAHSARIDDAIGFAATYIPDFQQTAPEIFAFGAEVGYTPEELRSVSDGRDLVVLNLARVAGNLLKAGIIDVRGNFLQAPQPIADNPTDPRLTGPEPPRTHGGPARANGGGTSVEAQLAAYLNMTDEQFEALTPEQLKDMENLQRQAMAG